MPHTPAKLSRAVLTYGSRVYPVIPNDTLPLPAEFDFENWEECARKIFSVMCNASGGFTMLDCKISIVKSRHTANLTCNGAHVYYAPDDLPKLTVEQAIALAQEQQVTLLGDVKADQYGDGWKRAVWTPAN